MCTWQSVAATLIGVDAENVSIAGLTLCVSALEEGM